MMRRLRAREGGSGRLKGGSIGGRELEEGGSSSSNLVCLLLVPPGLTPLPFLLLVCRHLGRVGSRGGITFLVIPELLIIHDGCCKRWVELGKMTCEEINVIGKV